MGPWHRLELQCRESQVGRGELAGDRFAKSDDPLVAVVAKDRRRAAVEVVRPQVGAERHRVADVELARGDELGDRVEGGEPVVHDLGDLRQMSVGGPNRKRRE